jgi:tetratricopeptide (TPR) repeat protein
MRKITIILLTFLNGLFLVGCITTLKTPEIRGVVLDAETGKPIEGVNVIARWSRTYSGPGGQVGGKAFKELRLKTNNNGAFVIPDYKVTNWVPYPFGQGGSFGMAVFTHGYKVEKFVFHESQEFQRPKYDEFKERKEGGAIIFKLEEIKDPDTFDKNDSEIYGFVKEDLNYQLKDYQIFITKFPIDKRVSGYRLGIGTVYEKMGKPIEAISEYEKIIKEYPGSEEEKEAKERIAKLKNTNGRRNEKE